MFAPLNAIMERCNDLLDLVQTVHDFRSAVDYMYNVHTCIHVVLKQAL